MCVVVVDDVVFLFLWPAADPEIVQEMGGLSNSGKNLMTTVRSSHVRPSLVGNTLRGSVTT